MSPLVHDGLVASAQVAVVLAGGWGASAALRRSASQRRTAFVSACNRRRRPTNQASISN